MRALTRGWEVLVRPLLEFSCEIWGAGEWKKLENLQWEMGRRVLGVSKSTTHEVIQGELGLQRLITRRTLFRLRYWSKLVELDDNRLVKKIYRARREEFIEGSKTDRHNWCYPTWKFLTDLGLEHVWESETFGSRKDWDVVLRATIKEKEEKFWQARVQSKSKLRLYKLLKTKLCLESYLNDLSRDEYRQLVMIRGGTNNLRIDKGRQVRPKEKRKERLCMVCLCQNVEDEEHFMLVCPHYVVARARMFDEIREKCQIDIESRENEEIMILLLGEGLGEEIGREVRKIVARYISRANTLRNQYVSL